MPIQCGGTFDTGHSFNELRDCHVKTRQAFDDLMSGFSDSDQVSWRHPVCRENRIGLHQVFIFSAVEFQEEVPCKGWIANATA